MIDNNRNRQTSTGSLYLLSDAVHAGIPATGFLILIPMSKCIIIPLE